MSYIRRPRNLPLLLAVVAIGLCFAASAARADACGALRNQLRASGVGANASQVAQLNRQIAAIRRVELQRKCSSGRSGGLFNACDSLAKRRADAERQLARAKLGKGGDIRARLAALGCEVARKRQPQQRRAAEPRRSSHSGVAMLFCVRLADGYYFPAPNSQFVGDDAYENTLDRCRYICNDPAMDVYRLDGGDLETEEMASIRGRRPYKDLPAAFTYRQAAVFKSCDLGRYLRRVQEARARTVTPNNMKNAIIPLPEPRPDRETYSSISSDAEPDAAVSAYSDEVSARRVRVVGPAFLPEQ